MAPEHHDDHEHDHPHRHPVQPLDDDIPCEEYEFLEIALRIPIRTETEVHPLEDANLALARLSRGEVSGAAVLACT